MRGGCQVLPKVTSPFVFHNLKFVASAEPLPLENGRHKNKQKQAHRAALALHLLNLGWPVELAIEQLENVKCVIGDLPKDARDSSGRIRKSSCKRLLARNDGQVNEY